MRYGDGGVKRELANTSVTVGTLSVPARFATCLLSDGRVVLSRPSVSLSAFQVSPQGQARPGQHGSATPDSVRSLGEASCQSLAIDRRPRRRGTKLKKFLKKWVRKKKRAREEQIFINNRRKAEIQLIRTNCSLQLTIWTVGLFFGRVALFTRVPRRVRRLMFDYLERHPTLSNDREE